MAIPNKIIELFRKWNEKFPIPVGEEPVRQWNYRFGKQVSFTFPNEGFCTKQASATRPLTKDTLTQAFPVGIYGWTNKVASAISWDMVLGAGTNNPRPIYGGNREYDIKNPPDGPQYLVELPPEDFLGEIPGPGPNPEPDPDRIKLLEIRNDIDEYLKSTTP